MVPKETRERYEKLKTTINRYRTQRHVHDIEEIPIEAEDALKAELADIEAEFPELIGPDSPSVRVGGAPLPQFKKVRHKVAQWSFNDAFSQQDMRDFDKRVKKLVGDDISYTCELKIDGLKVVLEYQKGRLVTAATRGDGAVGQDVAHNVRTIESVPLVLERPVDIIVEGEVWMSEAQLAALNKRQLEAGLPLYANPRNAAAGSTPTRPARR